MRCLRCGASLAPSAPATAGAGVRYRWLVLGAVAACVALGGFAVVIVAPHSTPAPAAATTPAPVRSAAPAVTAAVADTSTSSAPAAPAPAAAALDHSREGAVAYASGDVTSAIDRFQAAAAADPGNAMALNNLAQALVRAGRTADALPYFDRAIELAPETWAYRFNRGRAYAVLEAWPRAIVDYREAAALFPEDYVTQFNLARALQANGDLPAAIDAYQKAIALAPGQAEFQLALGGALERARRPQDAAAAYRHYLELEPASSQAEKIKERIAQLAP